MDQKPAPDIMATSMCSRVRTLLACARTARATQNHAVDPDHQGQGEDAATVAARREIRMITTIAGMTRTTLVIATACRRPAAVVAGHEADGQADHGGDGAGDQADDQRGPGAVDQVGDHALALVVGAEQQRTATRWRVVQPADGGVRAGLHDQRSDHRATRIDELTIAAATQKRGVKRLTDLISGLRSVRPGFAGR